MRRRGWQPQGEKFGIPNGPCYLFHDPSGNPIAFFENENPRAMEDGFAQASNPHAVRATRAAPDHGAKSTRPAKR